MLWVACRPIPLYDVNHDANKNPMPCRLGLEVDVVSLPGGTTQDETSVKRGKGLAYTMGEVCSRNLMSCLSV